MASFYRLAIGVDIGVSTSGASFELIPPGEQPTGSVTQVSLQQPDVHLQPTTIGAAPGSNTWGMSIAPGEVTLDLIKLALSEGSLPYGTLHARRLAVVERSLARIEQAGMDGVSAMTEFLRRFWGTCGSYISAELDRKGIKAENVVVPHFLFAIPAVWNRLTIERMSMAIQQSNVRLFDNRLGTVDVITEPKVAAIAVFPWLGTWGIRIGDIATIADFGGGTVDLISYKLESTAPLRVSDCVQAEGALLGDMYMKGALLSFIEEQVQACTGENAAQFHQDMFRAQVDDVWSTVSTAADGPQLYRVYLHRPDGIMWGNIALLRSDVVRELKSITDDILRFLDRHLNEVKQATHLSPKNIIVVGGFGCNKFLQVELGRHFGNSLRLVFTGNAGKHAVKDGAAIAAASSFGNNPM